VRFDFEVKITCNGNTLPNAQTIRVPLKDAFMQSLPTQTLPRTIAEIRSRAQVSGEKIWPDGELPNPNVAVYALSYLASRFADQVQACDAFQALRDEWSSTEDATAFMNELRGALFSALGITALPETYETIATNGGPGDTSTMLMATVYAVRDIDIPETLPSEGLDKRLQQLLDNWRAQEKARREAT
jgi:hypothetical protein